MKKVVVIGAGKRVINNILPALIHGRELFEVVGIYARSCRTIAIGKHTFNVEKFGKEAKDGIKDCDTIIVCVSASQVPTILNAVSQMGGANKELFIDTPVLVGRDIRKAKIIDLFSSVYVLEDWLGLAPITAIKEIVKNGGVGKVEYNIFHHSGYRNHALAAIRSLTNSTCLRNIALQRMNANVLEFNMVDSSGSRTRLLEPRNYEDGKILIVGETGSISNYELQMPNNYFVKTSLDGNKLTTECNSQKHQISISSSFCDQLVEHLSDGNNLMNFLKVQSLLDLLKAPSNCNNELVYTSDEAIYDKFMIDRACRHGRFFDVAVGQTSIVKLILKLLRK